MTDDRYFFPNGFKLSLVPELTPEEFKRLADKGFAAAEKTKKMFRAMQDPWLCNCRCHLRY